MTTSPSRKRFIAGAVCPQCHRLDTIALRHNSTGQEYITCVACDYYHDQKSAALPQTKPSANTDGTKPIVWHR